MADIGSQSLGQYLSQQVVQRGIIGAQTSPAITFAGTSWQQMRGSVTQKGATYTITLYVTQHTTHFYALALLAPTKVYTQMEQNAFASLRGSFHFL
jgi:hypothetical protein